MKKNSKRYKEIFKNKIKDKKINPKEALDLVKKNSTAKFDESIDVSLKINLKQSKGGDFSLAREYASNRNEKLRVRLWKLLCSHRFFRFVGCSGLSTRRTRILTAYPYTRGLPVHSRPTRLVSSYGGRNSSPPIGARPECTGRP